MKTCFIFPGQASFKQSIFNELYDKHDILRNYVQLYKQTFHSEPSESMLIYMVSCALADVYKSKNIYPEVVTGHSLGMYAAMHVAKMIDFTTGMNILHAREQIIMQYGPKNTDMMACMGTLEDCQELCKHVMQETDLICEPANHNAFLQTVISGDAQALQYAQTQADKFNIRACTILNIGYGYHGSLMSQAAQEFHNWLIEQNFTFKQPEITVLWNGLLNHDIKYYTSSATINSSNKIMEKSLHSNFMLKQKASQSAIHYQFIATALSQDLIKPVLWYQTMEYLKQKKLLCYELGMKHILSKFLLTHDIDVQTV